MSQRVRRKFNRTVNAHTSDTGLGQSCGGISGAVDPWDIYVPRLAYSDIQLGGIGGLQQRSWVRGSDNVLRDMRIKDLVPLSRPGVRCNGKRVPSTGILPPERTKRRLKMNRKVYSLHGDLDGGVLYEIDQY
jgi:hypothetical protein